MSSRSKVAAQDGPEGNDVEQRPALVQLDIMEEWMQLEPLVVGQSFEREDLLIWGALTNSTRARPAWAGLRGLGS